MTDPLLDVRTAVAKHKYKGLSTPEVMTAARAAFAQIKPDAKDAWTDESAELLAIGMFIAGAQYGSDSAFEQAKRIFTGEVARTKP